MIVAYSAYDRFVSSATTSRSSERASRITKVRAGGMLVVIGIERGESLRLLERSHPVRAASRERLARAIHRETEIVFQLDRIGDAQHDRYSRLLEANVLECKCRDSRADDVLSLRSRGDLPDRGPGDAVDGQVTDARK